MLNSQSNHRYDIIILRLLHVMKRIYSMFDFIDFHFMKIEFKPVMVKNSTNINKMNNHLSH